MQTVMCLFQSMIREGAVAALRPALVVTSQRETKEKERPLWYRVSYCYIYPVKHTQEWGMMKIYIVKPHNLKVKNSYHLNVMNQRILSIMRASLFLK